MRLSIRDIASTVRTFTERHRKAYWRQNLEGACAPSAKLLGHLLGQCNSLEARFVTGVFNEQRRKELIPEDSMHAWIILPTETIVDVTATQFGLQYPKVVVAKRGSRIWSLYTGLAFDDEAEEIVLNYWGWRQDDLDYLVSLWQIEGQAYMETAVAIEV